MGADFLEDTWQSKPVAQESSIDGGRRGGRSDKWTLLVEEGGNPSLPLASWMALGKTLYYSVPQFPYLENGAKIGLNFRGLL